MSYPGANDDGLRALGRQITQSGRPARAGAGGGRSGGGRSGGGRSGGGRGRRRRRRHTKLKWTLITIGVVVVVIVAGVVGYGFYLNSEVHRVAVRGLSGAATTGKDAGTENILMIGSTSRCALTKQTPAYGLCTQGVSGVNSDVIMILHLNPNIPSASILSIPRDLFIPNSRSDGAHKIDAALYEGPTQLIAAIEEDFGIPIQHYVELNFDSFAKIVTALGGITMYFPEPVFDAYSGLNVPVAGCHHLDGREALQVVRARHLQYKTPSLPATTPHTTWPQESESDLARIRRDHEFLRVLAAKEAKRGLSNPIADQQLVASIASDVTVDSTLSITDMVNLLLTYHSVSINKAPQLTLPVLVGNFGSYHYDGGTFGDVEFPTEPQDQSVIDQVLGVTADTDTQTGEPLPSPRSVTVSVVDGTGTPGQAQTTADALGKLGFQISGTGTTTPLAQHSETLVTYPHRTVADEADAELVARSLTGAVILAYGPTTNSADVTVTTGTDFTVAASAPSPASSTKATTTTSPPTTTTTAPTATTSTGTPSSTGTTTTAATTGFTAPSPSDQGLKPYDPRACPGT